MAKPTISYGHAWTHDGDSITDWLRNAGAPDLTDAALAVGNDDYLDMSCSNAASDGEWCTWSYPDALPELAINTDINPTFMIRYKTSVASAGLGLAVQAVYHTAGVQWIMGTDVAPKYSTTWKVETFTLLPGDVLDHIILCAFNEIDATANYIRVEFLTACQGVFTWPFAGGVRLEGFNNYARLKPVGKVGNTTQYLGADDSPLRVWGDIDTTGVDALGVPVINSGWHGRWTTHDAETFYQILHYASWEPWVWFTSDVASLKVTVDHFLLEQSDTAVNLLRYELELHEYRLGSANVETNHERWGFT